MAFTSDRHPANCDCDRYACQLRAKAITTRLDTGVSGMSNLTQTSLGQDGPKGRDRSGKML